MYPCTIIATRHRGFYEGGLFLAFNEHRWSPNLDGVDGDEVACTLFFLTYPQLNPIGRGATPQEAYDDLAAQLTTRTEHSVWVPTAGTSPTAVQ